jgi:hypothetical protein
MAGYKINRMSEDIRREMMDILRSMKDPRISGGMLSIVRIELSEMPPAAKSNVSALEGLDAAKAAVKVLKERAGLCPEGTFVRGLRCARPRNAALLRMIPSSTAPISKKILRQIGEESHGASGES